MERERAAKLSATSPRMPSTLSRLTGGSKSRAALFEFFGGDKKPEPPMRMTWHHVGFNAGEQIGFGEYTFQMNRRYHGVVVVRVRGGRISNWREYQYESALSWEDFTAKNPF
jgi:hypothetical protein